LEEGVREAIWSQVATLALPFGAVPTLALIGTGTTVPAKYAHADEAAYLTRALVLREPALRPAHFMRSVYFRPGPAMTAYSHDSVRTGAAVRRLPQILDDMYGDRDSNLAAQVQHMFCRFTAQVAAARAKRLAHGALTPSNISLDGRWIDFGRMSSVSDYGRLVLAAGQAPVDSEHVRVLSFAADFCFYLRKYLPAGQTAGLANAAELTAVAQQHWKARFEVEMLKLTGIAEPALSRVPATARMALFDCLQRLMQAGNREAFVLTSVDSQRHTLRMPPVMGRYGISDILQALAASVDRNDAARRLSHWVPEEQVRRAVVEAYWDVRSAHLQTLPAALRSAAEASLVLNGLRLNRRLQSLYHCELNPAIRRHIAAGLPVSTFIDDTVREARSVLVDAGHAGQAALDDWFGVPARVDQHDGLVVAGQHMDLARAMQLFRTRQRAGHPSLLDESLCAALP
jgi:hypothetical protein